MRSGYKWILTVIDEDRQVTKVNYTFSSFRSCIKQMEREFMNGRSVHVEQQYWESFEDEH